MSNSCKIFSLVLLVCLLPVISSADVLMLKDGQTITGKLQGADQTSVSFSVNGQTRRYQISEINSITFTSSSSAAATSTSPESGLSGRPTLSRRSETPAEERSGTLTPSPVADMAGSSPRSRTPEPPKPLNVTVHAGTVITVRMIDPADSATDQVGQTYRASLDEPLVVDGETVVPRGADVTAKLVSVAQSGRIAGRSELSLVLLDITIQGRKHELTTSEVSESGSSRGKQTATRAGVGAAIGAAIGAIAGGGKGAAIGAATGAGAGTAIQIATHGEQVKIPSETRLDFTLAQPLNL
jgi:YmgG-like glycine-zipper protein